jgi:cell division protein FtsI/penicillin-binding protein 2
VAALRRRSRLAWQAGAACFSLLLLPVSLLPQTSSSGLYAQAASALLNRSFPSHRVEYLLLDLRTRQTVAVRWRGEEKPIPVGSLLKPFVALAYAELHADSSSKAALPRQFPNMRCRGKSDGCWRAGGHGSLTLEQALAESCNAYFLALARDLSASKTDPRTSADGGMAAISRVSASYGLPAPPAESSARLGDEQMPAMLIGATPEWRVSPMALAQAYATLATAPRSEAVRRLLSGMRLAASAGGTAVRIGTHPGGVLAKTGTAHCVPDKDGHAGGCIANGDGLVVVLTPAENPDLLLLVRKRGTTGAQAAELAGQMLSRLEGFHARAQ